MTSTFGFFVLTVIVALSLPFAAVDVFTLLDAQCGAGTTASADEEAAPLLHSVGEVLPPLAAVVLLFGAVVFTNRHLMARRVGAVPVAAAAGNGRRSISGLLMFALCVSAGTLELIVFGGQAAGAGGGAAEDHRAWSRALGLAALRALPAAATATFFVGMMLVIVAHVRAGGEGGGGAGAVARAEAGGGPHQGLFRILTKVAAGMAAALVGLMLTALTLHGSKS